MNFKFNVNLTEQDYINFNKFHILKSDFGKKTNKHFKIIIIVLLIIATIITFIMNGIKVGIAGLLVFSLIGILTLLLTDKFLFLSTAATVKSLKKTGKLPYSPSSVVEFDEEGYIESNETEKNERKYSVIENVTVSEEYTAVYVFVSSASAVILPYSAFKSREELFAFIEFMKTKCSKVVYL